MTWILPRQLHTSAFALDTAALISDCDEQSAIYAQSLLVRSKPSPVRIWSQKWKRDSWTQHLSGRILKPSLGQAFVTAWTSSLEAIPASHSAPQGNDSAKTTHDTSGHGSQMEFELCAPASVSSRTSRDISASDSERLSKSWEALVTRRRGEYSARLRSEHLISGSESSSWPTGTVWDRKDTGDMSQSRTRKDGKVCMDTLGRVVQINASTTGNRQESWPTPRANDPEKRGNFDPTDHRTGLPGAVKTELWRTPSVAEEKVQSHSTQVYLQNQVGATLKSWATPVTADSTGFPRNMQKRLKDDRQTRNPTQKGNYKMDLKDQVGMKAWATPIVGDSHLASTPEVAAKRIAEGKVTLSRQTTGKLNPRWVETLMGLPVGWTMPRCAVPVTIVLTNCDFSETESSLPQPSEPFVS